MSSRFSWINNAFKSWARSKSVKAKRRPSRKWGARLSVEALEVREVLTGALSLGGGALALVDNGGPTITVAVASNNYTVTDSKGLSGTIPGWTIAGNTATETDGLAGNITHLNFTTTGGIFGNSATGIAASAAAVVTINDASASIGGAAVTIDNLATPNSTTLNIPSGDTLTVNSTISTTFAGNLTGAGNFAVTGSSASMFTLSAPSGTKNSISGTTTVDSGTLEAASPDSLSGYNTAGSITVADGATLAVQLGGTGQFASADVATLLTNATFADGSGVATLGLDVTGSNTVTYSSTITDATFNNPTGFLAVEKFGTGTLTLSGANTFSGGLTIQGGTFIAGVSSMGNTGAAGNTNTAIQLGTDTTTSASLEAGTFAVGNPVNVGSHGTLTLGNDGGTDDAYFSGAITLNGNALTIAATGTSSTARIVASGSISGTGNLVLNNSSSSGSIWLGFPPPSDVHAGPPQSPNHISNVGTIQNIGTSTGLTTISNIIDMHVTGVYQGTGSLTASPLVLAGPNTFTSGLFVQGGAVDAAQVSQALGAGTVTLGNTTGSIPAALLISTSFLQFSNPIVLAANANLSGVGGLAIGTTQAVTIGRPTDATATFSGGVTGNNNLTINVAGNGNLIFNGSPIAIGGTITNNGTGIGTTIISSNLPASVTGITENGTSNLILSGTNANTGADTITAGELSVGADANIGSGNSIVFNGGTLQITGTALTTAGSGMIGSHPYSINTGKTAGFDINDPNNTFTVNDALTQGMGGLTKLGAGTLVLTKANMYTGTTLIGGGTLQLGNGGTTGSLSPSSTIVDNSAGSFGLLTTLGTLDIDRSNTVTQGTDFSGNGIGTLTLTGNTASTGSTTAKETIKGLASTVLLAPGMPVSGAGIPAGAQISAILSATSIQLTAPATATATGVTLTFTETGGLANSGSGTTILTAANTYSGPTYVYSGALQVGNGGATGSIGTGPVTLGSGNLVYDLSSTVTVPNVIQNLTGGNPGGSAPATTGANPGHDMVQMNPSTGLEVADSSINQHNYVTSTGQLYQYHWGATGSDRPGQIPVLAPFNPIAVQATGNTVGSGALFYLTTNESTQNTSPTTGTISASYAAGNKTVMLTTGQTITADGISIGQVVEGPGIVTVPADVNGNGGPGVGTSPTGTFITSVDTVHNTFTLSIAPIASGTSLVLPALANLQANGIGGVQIVSGGGTASGSPGAVDYTQADVGKILTVAQGQGTFSIGHSNSLTPNTENYASTNVTPAQLVITQVTNGQITGVKLMTSGTYQPYAPVETGDQTLLDPIFAGSVSGTTLTVDSFISGTDAPYAYGFNLVVGQTVFDSSGNSLGTIMAQLTGPTGGIGSYTLSQSSTISDTFSAQTTTSITGSIAANVLTVSSPTGSPIVVGDVIIGTGIPVGTAITAQLGGTTGGAGTYQLATLTGATLNVASESMTAQLNQTLTTPTGAQLPIEANMLSPALTQPTALDNSDQNGQPSGYGSGLGYEVTSAYEMTSQHELYAPLTGDTTTGTNQILNVVDTSPAGTPYAVGYAVDGPGIPAGAVITAISGSSITLSQAATITATGSSFDSWNEWTSAIDPNTIAAGGSGYTNDATVVALGGVTAAGGAPLLGTVTTSGGVVTGFVASDATNNGFQGDAADSANWYSVLPTVPCPVSGGSGSGNPLFNLTMNDPLNPAATSYPINFATGIATATLVSGTGGSGYKIGDVLTLSAPAGVTPVGTAATLIVTAVDGSGAILAVNVKTAGNYTKWNPATLFYVAPVDGSGGSGAILSWQALQTSVPDNASSNFSPDAAIVSGGGYAVGDVLVITGGSWKDVSNNTVTWNVAPILQVTHYTYSSSGPSFTYKLLNSPVPSIAGEFPPSSVTFNVFPLGYTPSTTVIGPNNFYGAGINGGVAEFTAGATVNFGPQVFGGTAGSVIQEGSGTTILTGTTTYSGATQATGGTFQVNSTIAASSGLSVSNGATLNGVGGTTSTGILNLATLSFSGPTTTYAAYLNGLTPGTGYDQIDVSGPVSLNGATLVVNVGGGFNPALGTQFDILVNNSGSAPGMFAQGGTVTATNGAKFSISYTGGSGHDVILTYTQAGASSFLITAPSTTTAGTNFIFTVQELDASNNPTSAFSGTITFSTTDPQGVVPAPITLTNGFGFYLGDLKTVSGGPWAISVTGASGTISGTSAAIAVTPGAASKLAFGTQPVNTPTGVTLPAVTVQVLDAYGNVVTADNTDTVTLGIASGAGAFTAGSTTTATVTNGVATFNNLTLVQLGTYTLSELVTGLYTGPASKTFSVIPLQVLPGSFAGTSSGFSVQFNAPFLVNSTTPVLYGTGFGLAAGQTGQPPTVILTTDSNLSDTAAYVPGTVVLNTANNSLQFVETNTTSATNHTSPILPDGTYFAVIRGTNSLSPNGLKYNGLQALNSGGGFLDGTNSGTSGHDFIGTFTVSTTAAHDDVAWVPATADGPLQVLTAPGNNQQTLFHGGLPVYLDDTTGAVTSVTGTFTYNPTLLTVTGGISNSSLSGSTFTVTVTMPGTATFTYTDAGGVNKSKLTGGVGSSNALISDGSISAPALGFINATVPNGSSSTPIYHAKDVLTLSSIQINGGGTPSVGSSAVHLVAYAGDADGNGAYSSSDAVLITKVLVATDSGFVAYPLVDPTIVADTDGSGFLPGDAALQVNEAGVGFPTANLATPPVPPGANITPIGNNVDPALTLPSNLQVNASGTVTVLVNLDDAHPAGSTGLIRAELALTYNPRLFTVSAADVHPGSILQTGSGWSVVPTIDPVTGQIAIALTGATPINSSVVGSLITIDFHQVAGASGQGPAVYLDQAALSSILLVASVDPNGQYVATELEDAQGTFTLTPAPSNHFDPRVDSIVTLSSSLASTSVSAEEVPQEKVSEPGAAPAPLAPVSAGIVPDTKVSQADGNTENVSEPALTEIEGPRVQMDSVVVSAVSSLAGLGATAPMLPLLAIAQQISPSFSIISQPVSDQLFQGLVRAPGNAFEAVSASSNRDGLERFVVGSVVAPSSDAIDHLDWDSVSRLSNGERVDVNAFTDRRQVVTESQVSARAADVVVDAGDVDRYFAMAADGLDDSADCDYD